MKNSQYDHFYLILTYVETILIDGYAKGDFSHLKRADVMVTAVEMNGLLRDMQWTIFTDPKEKFLYLS